MAGIGRYILRGLAVGNDIAHYLLRGLGIGAAPPPSTAGLILNGRWRLDNTQTGGWTLDSTVAGLWRLDNTLTGGWSQINMSYKFDIGTSVPVFAGEHLTLNMPSASGVSSIAGQALSMTVWDREGGNVLLTLTTAGGAILTDAPVGGAYQVQITAAQTQTLFNALPASGRGWYKVARTDAGFEGVMTYGVLQFQA